MSDARYTAVAIVLHWAIAAAIIGNFALGLWMHEAIDAPQSQARAIEAYQLHKSIGLSVLLLSLLRLAWRLFYRPPPLPAGMSARQKLLANTTHWLFYGLMIAIPLSGWLYVSTQWRDGAPLNVPTLWFGVFEVPHLLGLNESSLQTRQSLAGLSGESHEILAFSMMALLILHVGAALKHHFVDRDGVLGRMLPMAVPGADKAAREPGRRWVLRAGNLLIAIAGLAAVASLVNPPESGSLADAVSITASSEGWAIDPEHSEIVFTGTHAGNDFRGHFKHWQANLQLKPDDVTTSVISATIYTGSATDGVRLHDKSLPEAEWFDVANHPTARFEATDISPDGDNRYRIAGILTIKGNEIDIPDLLLTMHPGHATISGRLNIDRADADLGMESDPRGEWVSRQIGVEVEVRAIPRE